MIKQNTVNTEEKTVDYVIFQVGDLLCGIDILDVQEIKKLNIITPVYRAPEYVRGVVNMRGHLITLIDIKLRFGMEMTKSQKAFLAIIVPHKSELIGIVVENVEDIVRASNNSIDAPPSNMRGAERQFISGILKQDNSLIAIIDKETVVNTVQQAGRL